MHTALAINGETIMSDWQHAAILQANYNVADIDQHAQAMYHYYN